MSINYIAQGIRYQKELDKVVSERDQYKQNHKRYEFISQLTPRAVHVLFELSVKTGIPLNDLVDGWVE
jgi:hypothetical protein